MPDCAERRFRVGNPYRQTRLKSIPITTQQIRAGVSIFKDGLVAGGIGVSGADPATVEYAGVAGTIGNGFVPVLPAPSEVIVGGIALPFVVQTTIPAGESPGSADGSYEPGYGPKASPGPTPV